MSKFAVVSSSATSLYTVGSDIAYILNKHGHEAMHSTQILSAVDVRENFEKAIVVMTFDPLYVTPYCLATYDYIKAGVPAFMYVTTEGVPQKHLIRDWYKTKVPYVAVSNYVKQMLNEVGIFPKAVVPHGVNFDYINSALENAKGMKDYLKKKLNVEVVFGTVASNHPRKNLPSLAQAIKLVNQNVKDAGFYIVTTEKGKLHFAGIDRVFVDTGFGKFARTEILTLIGAFDFLVHPAFSEGFGLPVLEAQALGVPVIHPNYAPLTEISHATANFIVPISSVGQNAFTDGINYTLHYFNVEDMAQQIINAYETYTSNKEEYNNRSEQVKEFAKKFDADNLYMKLASIV
jgi:glycosyltransferase involved in cell wall biosynthesis